MMGSGEILVILVVILILFGGKNYPSLRKVWVREFVNSKKHAMGKKRVNSFVRDNQSK